MDVRFWSGAASDAPVRFEQASDGPVPRFRGQPEASGAGIAVMPLGVVGLSGGGLFGIATVGEPISPLTRPSLPQGMLPASGPSEGSWVRRHVGASEFANSICCDEGCLSASAGAHVIP